MNVLKNQPMMTLSMKPASPLPLYALLAFLFAFTLPTVAQVVESPPDTTTQEVEAPAADPQAAAAEQNVEVESPDDIARPRRRSHDNRNVILHFSQDSTLPAGQTADAVISIAGSSTSAGDVWDAVVSVFGNTHVTGPVGDSAVAVFGNTYVNSQIGHDVVAVFGDVELGPNARVGGDVIVVNGELIRDPAVIVRGDIQQIALPLVFGNFEWLRPWVKHCLLYGRPLALEPGLGWAWSLAFGFLTLYVVLALLFSSSVEKCVDTLETRPGHTLLASILTLLLTPVLTLLLTVTVIGIALVPFVWLGLFIAGLFGKAVILAALGRRLTGFIGTGPLSDIAFAVLVGGLIVLASYVVPVIGFVVYKLIGILGLGVVVYTLILAAKARRDSAVVAAPAFATAAAPAAPAAAAASADTFSAQSSASEPAAGPSATFAQPDSAPAATASAAPQPSDLALPRAGFWIRMAALLIDIILVGVAFSVLQSDGIFLPALAAYGAVMWKLKGTTIGGILCNLKVVRLDGRELDWGTAAVRALSCFLSLAVAGLGFLWIVFDDGRQAWHDKIAGTAVVRVPQGVSLV